MSKYNNYALRIAKLAEEVRAEQIAKTEAFNTASEERNKYPSDIVNAYSKYNSDNEIRVKAFEADAKMRRAKEAYNDMNRNLQYNTDNKIAKIRSELVAEVEKDHYADPEQLDTNTLELLRSGILSPSEYASLFDKAEKAGNITMVRLIGNYAGKRAEEVAEEEGLNSEKAKSYRTVSYAADKSDGSAYIKAFDTIADALHRAARNPGMWQWWDGTIGDIIESF